MTRHSHLFINMVATYAIFGAHNLLSLAAVAAGTFAPDLDIKVFGSQQQIPFKERTLLSHRGITHHVAIPVLLFIFSFLLTGISAAAVKWFALGYALHLFEDMFSVSGIPYGLKYQDRVRLNLYITGAPSEFVIVLLFTTLIVLLYAFHAKKIYGYDMNKAISSAYTKYLSIKNDNKTIQKYKKQLNVNKILKNQRTLQSAENMYQYYQTYIVPKQQVFQKKFLKQYKIDYSSIYPKGQILKQDEYIYIFMSSSVPLVVWKNYAFAVNKLREENQGNIGIVLRGCINGCQKVMPTVRFLMRVLNPYNDNKGLSVPVMIDPLLFRLYNIKRVPAFVYAKGVELQDITASQGLTFNLKSKNITAYKVLGDCSFKWALQELYRLSGDNKLLQLKNLLNKGWFEK